LKIIILIVGGIALTKVRDFLTLECIIIANVGSYLL